MRTSHPGFRNLDLLPGVLQRTPEGLINCHTRDGPPSCSQPPAVMEMLTPAALNRVKPSQVKAPGTFLHVNAWSKFLIILWWCRTLWLRRWSEIWTKPNLNIVRLKNHDTKRSCKHVKAAVSVGELFILTVITDTACLDSILLMRRTNIYSGIPAHFYPIRAGHSIKGAVPSTPISASSCLLPSVDYCCEFMWWLGEKGANR